MPGREAFRATQTGGERLADRVRPAVHAEDGGRVATMDVRPQGAGVARHRGSRPRVDASGDVLVNGAEGMADDGGDLAREIPLGADDRPGLHRPVVALGPDDLAPGGVRDLREHPDAGIVDADAAAHPTQAIPSRRPVVLAVAVS